MRSWRLEQRRRETAVKAARVGPRLHDSSRMRRGDGSQENEARVMLNIAAERCKATLRRPSNAPSNDQPPSGIVRVEAGPERARERPLLWRVGAVEREPRESHGKVNATSANAR